MRSHALIAFAALAALSASAHDVSFEHQHGSAEPAVPLKSIVEDEGPVKVQPRTGGGTVSGAGYWQFMAMKELVPTPPETKSFLKGAHGTIIVDKERDLVYWGLEKVGWVAFSNKLSRSWVVKGDPMFSSGNLHGADILPRAGKLPMVVAADDVEGEVYLSDTSFQHAEKLDWPQDGPYKLKKEFKPTDATFVDGDNVWVTDGYGKHWFRHAKTEPLKFDGPFIGGDAFSRTPHGITYNPDSGTLLVAARPEAIVKEYAFKDNKWLESMGLPADSTVCDVDVWGDYALAPCLDGPNKTPGPIYIINLKKKAIVSTIRVKEDLGYADALHIHDATWYVRGTGDEREVYILFTNWNPGGIGAIKLVGAIK